MRQKEKVIGFIKENMKIPMSLAEMAVMMSVPDDAMPEFVEILEELEQKGKIVKTKRNRYAPGVVVGKLSGRFIGNERGFGFVETEDDAEDIFISKEHIGGALHGDIVLVKLLSEAEGNKRREGEVIKILQSAEHRIVGRMDMRGTSGFLVPANRRYAMDFFVPKNALHDAKHNDMVVAELSKRATYGTKPEANIISVLGNIQKPGVDILAVVESRNIPYRFSEDVLDEAKKVAEEQVMTQQDNRTDFRAETIITIDGDDAKDLDDAVHVKKLSNGNFELGVHIADVSHYVAYRSALDEEAYKRGTSIYLADRVIPMLPEILSNGICSLHEGKERLTLSVVMEIDAAGVVVNYHIAEGIISSKHRMTYTDVAAILEGDSEKRERFSDIVPMLEHMERLRNILRKKRVSRGSIDFHFDEARIILDENGVPVEIVKRERSKSTSIIEEFMLVCNETVAEHMFWLGLPMVYRIHEEPEPEVIKEFAKFIAPMGYTLRHSGGKLHPRELAELIRTIDGTKEEMIISNTALRSLMKARYSAENAGHFGLAAKYYCHFTSPIRRYPDLAVHRMIKAHINGTLQENKMAAFAQDAAKHSSERELEAVDIERTVEDMKKAELMQERLGDVYDAVVSGVTPFGMFAALDNTIEGLIRMQDILDDYYIFDETQRCITGERSGKVYRVGDAITVQVTSVDVPAGKIDFVLYDENNDSEHFVRRKKKLLQKQKAKARQQKNTKVKTARYLQKKKTAKIVNKF